LASAFEPLRDKAARLHAHAQVFFYRALVLEVAR
jgi:hypothetical protein